MIQYTQQNRQVRIDTPLGDDKLLLQSLQGKEGLSRGFEYVAIVLSDDSAIDGNAIVGKQVSVTYFDEDSRERVINGYVSRFEYARQVEEPASLTAYSLTLVPWMWFLSHNSDCQIFQDMTAPDIIKKIFSDLGFNDFTMKLQGNYPEREYCVQYRETDFNFVSRLMEEEGIFYYYTHEKGKHTLVIADEPSGYYKLDESDVQYGPLGQSHLKQLTDWRHIYEFRPGNVAQKDFNFKKPTDHLKTEEKSQIQFENSSKLEIYDYPGIYEKESEGKRLTKVRLEELEAEHDHIEGAGHYLSFSPGGKFTIDKHSRQEDEGKSFVLTEVYTEMNSNVGSESSGEVDFHNEFRCIPAETTYRPARLAEKPLVEGPQTAIVATDGQEIVVDEFARVKVQFHWDRYGQSDLKSSCWIRVSQVHAGKGWGMIDIPRKDEEVIVSFLNGDPDRPIITGRVYNGNNNPPFGLKGAGNNAKNKNRRGNTTKSYEATGYNELTMDDTAGEEQIRIHAQYDMATTVEHDQTLLVKNNRTNTVKGTFTETITKDTKITIESGSYTHKVAANKASYHVEKDLTETYNGNQTTTVTKNINYTSQQSIVITAADDITLKVGESRLSMDSKGNIILKGVNVRVDASKAAEVSSAAKTKIGVGSQTVSCDKSKLEMSGVAINSSAVGMHEITGAVVKIN